MALVDQIHALATKCAQMDKDLDTRLSSIASITEVEQSLSNSKDTVPSSYAVKEAIDEVAKQGGGSGRNIGEVFYSLIPLVDATVHLLNGGLIYQEGIYQNFVNYMVDLYEDGNHSNLFITESEFQQSIATYEVCGKFVWDSVNKTLRLPKVTGFMQGTVIESAIGDLVEAGLPNITGETGGARGDSNITVKTGVFNDVGLSNAISVSALNASNMVGLKFDASLSNSIYGNSDTVQPQAVKGYVYIVLANAVKTQIEVDIDDVATELNGKADVDFGNCTKPYITETWHEGTEWYRVWSDGWCEQGGYVTNTNTSSSNVNGVITLHIPFLDTNYTPFINAHFARADGTNSGTYAGYLSKTVSTIGVTFSNTTYINGLTWEAKGYIS